MTSRRAVERRGRREAGLTVVEMLLALALLAFVLLGITPLFMASVKSNYSGNEYTSINVLARDRLEQLMNLPFDDGQLTPGMHPAGGNDLPGTLPNPVTGVSESGGVINPFRVCYQVFQFRIPTGVAEDASFTPIAVAAAGEAFSYKRIDVTVRSTTGRLGIGTRVSRVSGILSNPFPERASSLLDGSATTDACP